MLVLRALANTRRFEIMGWPMDPMTYFPPQGNGDLVEDRLCVGFMTAKIGLRQPTVTTHMQILADAGLVTSKKIRNWALYIRLSCMWKPTA